MQAAYKQFRVGRLIVLGGPAANGVDEKLADILGAQLLRPEYKRFPDGEAYLRVPRSLRGEEVVVVQSFYPPQDSHLLEALILIDAALNAEASRVVLAVPYLAYSRQDKVFLYGEPISVRAVLKSLRAAGAHGIIVVDIHREGTLSYFEGPNVEESAIPELAEYARNWIASDKVLVLSPDLGGVKRARSFAEILGAEWSYIRKERDRVTGEVRMEPVDVEVKGKTVIIVDDIISTGGTLAKSSRMMLDSGASKVYAMCTHPLLAPGALERLKDAGILEVVATDTIPSPISKVTSAHALARGVNRLI